MAQREEEKIDEEESSEEEEEIYEEDVVALVNATSADERLSLARERMRYGESNVVKRALERGMMDPNTTNAKELNLVHLAVL